MEVGYGARAGERAAELAMHFEHGRDIGRAVRYQQQAAAQALGRYAYAEAIAYSTRALALLQSLPDTAVRAQQELAVQLVLGTALMTTQGHAAPVVERTYTRAYALCQQAGEDTLLFPTLWGLWRVALNRPALARAQEVGEQLLALTQRLSDSGLQLEAHLALGMTLWYRCELQPALTHLTQAWTLYVPDDHRPLARLYGGYDPGVPCLCYLATALWMAGYPTQAEAQSQAALTLARDTAQPYSLAVALHFAAVLAHLRRDVSAVLCYADERLALTQAQGFPHWKATGTVFHGWALAMHGAASAGLAEVRQGIDALMALGAGVAQPYWGAILVEVYDRASHSAEGLAVAAEMLLRVEQTDDRFYETELYRLQGELQRYPNARVQADAAETSLSQALAHHPPPRGEVL